MAQINQVFLVDDCNINNFINRKIILDSSFAKEVVTFDNAVEAVDALRHICNNGSAGFPDLIFLDINMPVMDGWEFLEEFEKFPEERTGKCKIVILSSSINEKDIRRSRSHPIVRDYMSKPLTKNALLLWSELL